VPARGRHDEVVTGPPRDENLSPDAVKKLHERFARFDDAVVSEVRLVLTRLAGERR
jgi:hypothetical protein